MFLRSPSRRGKINGSRESVGSVPDEETETTSTRHRQTWWWWAVWTLPPWIWWTLCLWCKFAFLCWTVLVLQQLWQIRHRVSFN